MSVKKRLKHCPKELLAAKGLFKHDWEALTPCQRECATRLAKTIQIEQESYMSKHPEVLAMLKTYVASLASINRRNVLSDIAFHFARPNENIITDINAYLGVKGPPFIQPDKITFSYQDQSLTEDLVNIIYEHYPRKVWDVKECQIDTPDTVSSDFISMQTSTTTLPTPEPEQTPEPTVQDLMVAAVLNVVDKAILHNVNEKDLRYDTAYVELMHAVEEAMEIPVYEIKEDIAIMFFEAYANFEKYILQKEYKDAEEAWKKRMRKKLKHTLRLQKNFKGYETPPTPKSNISSHPSYRVPPPKPCQCFPQFQYNRYRKDRFGVYVASSEEGHVHNITETPKVAPMQFDAA